VAKLHKLANTDSPQNVSYEFLREYALVKSPKQSILDEEFIGSDVKKEVILRLYKKTKQANSGFSIECISNKQITLTLSELELYLLPKTTLAEFTKERRGYNSRIINNESLWMEHFNK
jgi:hypothetical protein